MDILDWDIRSNNNSCCHQPLCGGFSKEVFAVPSLCFPVPGKVHTLLCFAYIIPYRLKIESPSCRDSN